jgi:type I restriction enzyme, S subunit
MWAWMGALGVSARPGIVSPSYGVYRPVASERPVDEYMDALLRSRVYVAEFVRRSTGIRSSRLRLYPERFLDIPIVQPPVDEQHRIVDYIKRETATLAEVIGRTNQQIELVREYRTRLIADVVSGKLDVREAAANLADQAVEAETMAVEEGEELETGEENEAIEDE